ncbi:MAG TPA: tyrosine-type recombinase/integrase [Rubricoccaceae bacterium]
MPDLDADVRAIARILSKGGYSYDGTKALVKQARALAGLKRPKHSRGEVDRLSEEEQERFVAAAYTSAGVHGLMVQTLLLAGLRVAEFVALRVEDLSMAEMALTVQHGKGDVRRTVTIPSELGRALRVHVGDRQAGPLFVSRAGGAYTTRRVQQIVKATAEAAGISKPVHPHLLRHTYAAVLRRRGVPVDVIREQLGHKHGSTTELYYGRDPRRVAEAIRTAFANG